MRNIFALITAVYFFAPNSLFAQQLNLNLVLVSNTATTVSFEVLVSKTNPEPMSIVALSTVFSYSPSQISPASVSWTESSAFSGLMNPIAVHLSNNTKIAATQVPRSTTFFPSPVIVTNTPVSFGVMTITSAAPIVYPLTLTPVSLGNPSCEAVVYHNGATNSTGRSLAPSPGGISVNPIVIPEPVLLNLTQTFIQGYLDGATMRPTLLNSFLAANATATPPYPFTSTQCDTVTAELHSTIFPYGLLYVAKGMLNVNGTATLVFPPAANGNSYYIVLKSRNSLETWSASPVSFNASTAYHFGSISQAYGSNLSMVGNVPAMYSGDMDTTPFGDGEINLADYGNWIIADGALGYFPTDLDGDGEVNLADYGIWVLNDGVLKAKP